MVVQKTKSSNTKAASEAGQRDDAANASGEVEGSDGEGQRDSDHPKSQVR